MKATSILTGGFGGGGKAVAGGGLGGIGGAAGGDKGGGMFGTIRGLAALGGPLAPKILLGATVLSGVIAILGLGFAAAAFTIGKALPSMAEGLTSFSQIDGKNLALVGTGLLGLSTGLAAFTATMVAASAGNIFTSLVNGITTLFGGSTIMSKMTEFANIGPGLKLAGDGLMNIANGINSIDLTKAESLSKILPKISSSGLTAASMGSIKSSTIDSPSTVSSVSTSTKQAERPETYTAGGPGKKEVAGESGINTLLTTQNGLIERLLGSSNDLISVNREILKYVKLQA
jgi:hypothetical protein